MTRRNGKERYQNITVPSKNMVLGTILARRNSRTVGTVNFQKLHIEIKTQGKGRLKSFKNTVLTVLTVPYRSFCSGATV